jgi:hypothetical protein
VLLAGRPLKAFRNLYMPRSLAVHKYTVINQNTDRRRVHGEII